MRMDYNSTCVLEDDMVYDKTKYSTLKLPDLSANLAIFLKLIDQSGHTHATKINYKSALTLYVNAGLSLTNEDDLTQYAATLSDSQKRLFNSARGLWIRAKRNEVKRLARNHDVPVHEIQRMLWILDTLQDAIKVGKIETGDKAHNWLTLHQQDRLMKVAESDRDTVLVVLMLSTGMRRTEASQARFDDIKQQGNVSVLQVHGKGKKNRIIPLGQRLLDTLEDWRGVVGGGYILRSVNKGGAIGDSMSDVSIFRNVRKLGRLIDVDDLAPHDLRRTFAENLKRHGVDIERISLLLGHESIETTMRYLQMKFDATIVPSELLPAWD